jgi:hypothetical protein
VSSELRGAIVDAVRRVDQIDVRELTALLAYV